ncbi:hypothetical protein F4818DRAFT_247087 [Hypoxylon cercidicola]|nr:hypothetical protein F4818DRAFT_247087 [Hypoxylon cercidicola]
MEPTPDVPASAETMFDWDAWVLKQTWSTFDWRLSRQDLERIPWERLQRSTVDAVARLHRRYDRLYRPNAEPELSPAHLEQLRRLTLHTTPHVPAQPRPVSEWLGPVRKRGPYVPLPTSRFGGKVVDFLTVGFELDMPIAVYRRGGLLADRPHPHDTRGEAEEIVSDDVDPQRVKSIVINKVLTALNSQTDLVVVRKDDDEGDELFNERMRELQMMDDDREDEIEDELPYDSNSPSRSGPQKKPPPQYSPGVAWNDNIEEKAIDTAKVAMILNFPCSDPLTLDRAFDVEQSLVTATENDMWRAIQRVPIQVYMDGAQVQVRNRAFRLLQLKAFQLRRDVRHIALEGMKPRHRAFSVYTLDDAPGARFVTNGNYADPPEEDAKSLYGWETVRISSPVMAGDTLGQFTAAAGDICRVMRANFRIHREMIAIPATTQVVVSHTNGFTIQEVKKLLGMYAVLEPYLARLNRDYRSKPGYETICGSVKTESNLGQLAQTGQPWNDPRGIMPRISDEERGVLLDELNRLWPTDLLFSDETSAADQIFYAALWTYPDITTLCRNVTRAEPNRKTGLTAQCRGGIRTENVDATADDEFEAARQGWSSGNYDVVDPGRGVFKFRCAATSMDPMHLVCWTVVCLSIADFAKNADDHSYRTAITQILRREAGILDILKIPQDVQGWYRSRIRESDGFFRLDDVMDKISWNDPFYSRI